MLVVPELECAQNHAADVLVYPEIGMDPGSYLLAFSRLAPVQVVTHGCRPTPHYASDNSAQAMPAPPASPHWTTLSATSRLRWSRRRSTTRSSW